MRQETLAMIYAAAILAAISVAMLMALGVLIVCCGQSATPQGEKKKSKSASKAQLYESQSGEAEEPLRFPAEFSELVQSMMSKVSARCEKAKDKFAVLLLLPDRELRDVSTNLELDSLSELANDSESCTFPLDDQLSNYIAAGSRGPGHAENIVLGKLDILMEKFGEDKCKAIVLCGTLLLCDSSHEDPEEESCKAAIIEKLGPLAKSKRVIVVYGSKPAAEKPSDPSLVGEVNDFTPKEEKNDPPEEEESIVRDLTGAGMEVRRVQVDPDPL